MRRTIGGAKKRATRSRAKKKVLSSSAGAVQMKLDRSAAAKEDRLDAEDGRRALAESRAKGEQPIPWEQVKAELGL